MSAIDVHTHAFPDDLAERAIAQLEARCPWKAVAGGTVADLLASMDRADIDVSVLCAIATKPGQVRPIFRWCQKVRSDRIEPFPSVHPAVSRAGKWVERIAEAGFAGIKLHPMYQGFALDDPAAGPIYAAASDCGLVVAVHCGRDIGFPDDDDRAAPLRVRRVIDRFPRLKLLCTHLGGWRAWEDSEALLVGTGVYLETSFSLNLLPRDRAAALIRRHGTDRVLFGTDWPWQPQDEGLSLVRGLGLTAAQTRAILWSNAARLLGY